MAVFAIMPTPATKHEELYASLLQACGPTMVYRLEGQTGWFASAPTDAQSLAEQLLVSGEKATMGGAIIVEVRSYWGRANPNLWTWIREKLGSSGDD